MSNKKLKINKQTWEIASPYFFGTNALPNWGPFGAGENDPSLIGSIGGKVFLELACGSGHSIKYLIGKGAKKVYGVDFSHNQIEAARRLNSKAIAEGKVELFKAPMEKILPIKNADTAFSIYGIGWTMNPGKLFKNIYSYLKPGGRFVWSFDHTIFSDVESQRGKLVVVHSYHDDREEFIKGWRGGKGAYITYRKTATWFKLLTNAGFKIVDYSEPKPRLYKKAGYPMKNRYYAIQKAKMIPATMIFICEK